MSCPNRGADASAGMLYGGPSEARALRSCGFVGYAATRMRNLVQLILSSLETPSCVWLTSASHRWCTAFLAASCSQFRVRRLKHYNAQRPSTCRRLSPYRSGIIHGRDIESLHHGRWTLLVRFVCVFTLARSCPVECSWSAALSGTLGKIPSFIVGWVILVAFFGGMIASTSSQVHLTRVTGVASISLQAMQQAIALHMIYYAGCACFLWVLQSHASHPVPHSLDSSVRACG